MNIENIINTSIPYLTLNDQVQKAIDVANDLALSSMPIVSDSVFCGLVTVDMLLDRDPDELISVLEPYFNRKAILGSDHFFSAIKYIADHKTSLVPIVEDQNQYLGVVTSQDIHDYMGNLTLFSIEGGILIISMPALQYSLQELSRLAESNDASIMASFVTSLDTDPTEICVTLKFNKTDLTRVIATYERFSFNILAVYHQSDLVNRDIDRLEHLFRYLNV